MNQERRHEDEELQIEVRPAWLLIFGMAAAAGLLWWESRDQGFETAERLAWIALDLTAAGLFWELARRRVGDWGALAPSGLLLVFGASGAEAASPDGTAMFGAVTLILGALLFVERGAPADRLAACTAAIGAVAVWVLHYDQINPGVEEVLALPIWIAESFAATCAAIAGTFRSRDLLEAGEFHTAAGWVIGVAGIGLAVAGLSRRRDRPIGDLRLWGLVALPLAFWALTGLGLGPADSPEGGPYLYPGAVMLLLLGAEVISRLRPQRAVGVAIAVALGFALLANVSALRDNAALLRDQATAGEALLP